jgi:hypothetical protein
LRDGGAVADAVQRFGQRGNRAQRLADPVAGPDLDERFADRRDRRSSAINWSSGSMR